MSAFNGAQNPNCPFFSASLRLCAKCLPQGYGDEDVATPFENGNGAAMSSSPWESLCNGDEDVATPFREEAVSR